MDTNIYTISKEQKDVLVNSNNGIIVFRPIQDINGSYLISEKEFNIVNNLENCPEDLLFIKSLTSSIYEPSEPTINLEL
jgi:hypothetical protein